MAVNIEPLRVRLPGDRSWVGYRFEPVRIGAGTPLSVTVLTHQPGPPADPLETIVYLTAPGNSDRLARQEMPVSREPVAEDHRGGEVWAEAFVLNPPEDLPVGAYYVSASARKPGETRFAHLYQGEDTYPVDRATLGYVVVPWHGDLDAIADVGARIGDAITLRGYTIESDPAPGGTLTVRLYWEAAQPAASLAETHFVFVHLLDADGALVAQDDGAPAGGRYPPQAWFPGDVVPDDHALALHPELPPGTYTPRAGMYLWPSMDRLPARDATGTPLPDDVIMLGTLTLE
ncbi:MAG: hypothetical protein ACP5HG_08700 [Anaerolineae bacterium]